MGAPQVIKAVLKDAEDDTLLSLLYANQSPDDILLFDELQEMAKDPRFRIWYTGASIPHPRSSAVLYDMSVC